MKYIAVTLLIVLALMSPEYILEKGNLPLSNDIAYQLDGDTHGLGSFFSGNGLVYLRWGLIFLGLICIVVAWNLSLRKQMEKRRAAEEHFKKLADLTYEGILFHSNGIIVDGNRQLGEMFHCSFEEMLGKSILEYMAPQEHEKLLDIIKCEKNCHFDTMGVRSDGELFALEIQSRLFSGGDTPTRVASLRDISQRKKREQELEDSRKKLEKLSQTDGLTQVYNRRHFNVMMQNCLNQAKRNNQRITLAIMDVDFFKQYNDTYGHLAGDQALVQVASKVKELYRRSADHVFRLGGEEFAVVIQGELKQNSLEDLGERIRHEVEAMEIIHESSTVMDYLTVSLGIISLIPSQDISDRDLYRLSDLALYQAKEEGRNRVVVSSQSHPL